MTDARRAGASLGRKRAAIDSLPPPVLVDTPEALSALSSVLAGESRLALDTEADSLYRYFHKVCLIQVSTPTRDYLIDPLRLPHLAPVGDLLADSHIEKVLHAAENDILALKRDFGFEFANVFDTMVASRILGRSPFGLASLLHERFGVALDKRTQLTDWGHRPLTPRQLSYARLDSHYLLPLRDLLAEALQTRNRWREALEAFALLPNVTPLERSFDPEDFWRIKGTRDLRPTELAVLRELYIWRDGQARAMDLPPFKIVADHGLIRLSREQPQQVAGLHLSPWQISHFGHEILAAIARARAARPPEPPTRRSSGGTRPDAATTARYDRLRRWRTQKAADRGVDLDVVLTNGALLSLAKAAPESLDGLAALGVLGAWKLEEYGPELLDALA